MNAYEKRQVLRLKNLRSQMRSCALEARGTIAGIVAELYSFKCGCANAVTYYQLAISYRNMAQQHEKSLTSTNDSPVPKTAD